MQAKARYAGSSRAIELETDTATLKHIVGMVAGTVGILAVLGVAGVLIASGSVKTMLGYSPYVNYHRTEAEKLAGKVVVGCKVGAVMLVASRDEKRAAAGRDLGAACDDVGAAIKDLPVTR